MDSLIIQKWTPKNKLHEAVKEARLMEIQYNNMVQYSFSHNLAEHILLEARIQYIESQSFVVSFKHRGYTWACDEAVTKRLVLSEIQLIARQQVELLHIQQQEQFEFINLKE